MQPEDVFAEAPTADPTEHCISGSNIKQNQICYSSMEWISLSTSSISDHITMTLDPKDTITRSLITPQNSISDLLFPILCFNITGISGIIFFCMLCLYVCSYILFITASNHMHSLNACTFVTCLLNVIELHLLLFFNAACWALHCPSCITYFPASCKACES